MLTTEQEATLIADILANPDTQAAHTLGDTATLAMLYNAPSDPAYTVWDNRVDPNAIMANGIVWADFKNLSAGQLAIWELMTMKGFINAGKLNERLGLEEAFGKNSATNTGLQPHLKRVATRLEKLFATGLGTSVSPSTLSYFGAIGPNEFAGL